MMSLLRSSHSIFSNFVVYVVSSLAQWMKCIDGSFRKLLPKTFTWDFCFLHPPISRHCMNWKSTLTTTSARNGKKTPRFWFFLRENQNAIINFAIDSSILSVKFIYTMYAYESSTSRMEFVLRIWLQCEASLGYYIFGIKAQTNKKNDEK